MDLVKCVQDLSSKIDLFVNPSASSDVSLFQLREEIRAEANGIAYAVEGPEMAMKTIARGYTICSAMKVCLDLNLAQQLPQTETRSLEELAESSGCDMQVLRPILRVLSLNGIFQQTPDGRWTHTDLSAEMAKRAFHAYLSSILEEKYRSTAHLPHYLKETKYRCPSHGNTAFNAVYGTPLNFYNYFNEFDQEAAVNFAVSMEEWGRNQLSFIESAYPLDRVDPNSRFVDIAGGFGNLSCFLAKKLPKATFVVQDHPFIVEKAQNACPPELQDRISFTAQDMFSPQPKFDHENKMMLVYLLKIILHEYTDAECKTILKHLLPTMGKGDRVLIIDTVIPEVGGSLSSSFSDLIVLSMFGAAGHRTLKEWSAWIKDCGDDLGIETFSGGAEEGDGLMVVEITKTAPVS